MLLLKEPLGEREKRFRQDCLKFMIELCVQIRKRFPEEEENILALLNIMDPKEALFPERHMKSISKLAVHFPNIIEELDELQDQWRDLLYFSASLGQLSKTAVPFWHELGNIKDGNNHAKFDKLSRFMCDLMALPHSSASVERVFSQLHH